MFALWSDGSEPSEHTAKEFFKEYWNTDLDLRLDVGFWTLDHDFDPKWEFCIWIYDGDQITDGHFSLSLEDLVKEELESEDNSPLVLRDLAQHLESLARLVRQRADEIAQEKKDKKY